MKKLLLTSLLSVLIFGSAFGQIRWQTNTTIGQELKAVNTADKDTLILNFKNTVPFNTVSTWAPAKATANLGKDSVYKKTLQTQRGIQSMGFYAPTGTAKIDNGSFRARTLGNENPGRVASVDSLKAYLKHSVITGTINGSTSDSLTRPAACLFNVGTDEIAFGMWPGRCTRIEYLYYFDYTSKACPDDFTFDMWTYDAGNTGKTATYTLGVYTSYNTSTFVLSGQIGSTVNIYTTGDPKKNVKLAESIGVTPADLSNKKLYIAVYTMGTNNDGLANPVDANNIPTLYDPTIVFDNFVAIYSSSSWTEPAGAVGNAVFNHNNGSPEFVGISSTDRSGGTPVKIYGGSDQPIKMYFTSKDRIGTFEITESNDGSVHGVGFSFAETGAIKKKDESGNYTIDLAYTRTINADNGIYKLVVPAPTSGSANDELEVTMLGNVNVGATRAIRLELTNGIRFWYNVSITADTWTSNNIIDLDKPQIWSTQSSIFVANANNDVQIFNVAGQKIKVATAKEAESGISVQSGIYVIRTGATVQKVIVE